MKMGAARTMWLFAALLAGTGMWAAAQDHAAKVEHIIVTPDDLKWVDAPPSMPPGAKLALIEGNPQKPGLLAMRLKLPRNYKLMPHTHPADEHVTVISGTFYFGPMDTPDESKAKKLPSGSFAMMPAGSPMYGFTKDEECIIQIHAMGPWGIKYVNPADDPRNKK